MRICVVLDGYRVSGPEMVVAEMIEAWPSEDDEFILVAPHNRSQVRPFIEGHTTDRCKWVESPVRKSDILDNRFGRVAWQYPYLLASIYEHKWLFRELKPDIVFTNNGGYPGSDLCRSASIGAALEGVSGIVMAVHNLARRARMWQRIPEEAVDRWIDRCAYLVFVSEAARSVCRDVRSIVQSGTVIHNGVRPIGANKKRREDLCEEFGVPAKATVMCMVAAFAERKGHRVLFRALQTIQERLPEWRLLLFGSGSDQETARIRSLITRYGLSEEVVMCGFKTDIRRYLSAVDLLVLPSLRDESLPMAVIEAMAARVPVVASDVGGVRELIQDGESGIVVEPGESDVLGRTIETIVCNSDLRRELATGALCRYRSHYTATRMASDYHSLFRRTLEVA